MASVSLEAVKVTCNWKVINDKELQNSVSVVDSRSSSINFDDLVTLDSCIALSQQDDPEMLEININVVNPNLCVKDVFVVSEARLLELYGRFGEYDNTTNAVNTEDGDEDMQVFRAKLTLKLPSTQCSIKFAGIANDKREMWLLGLGIVLEPYCPSEEVDTLASRVSKILQESRVPLSQNAENCRKIVLGMQGTKAPGSSMESEMKQYVDKVCGDFEANLINHIDMKFKEIEDSMNKRLDDMLTAINKKS